MKTIFSASQIKQSEEEAFAAGISVDFLMQNAGRAVAQRLLERKDVAGQNVLVMCGNGNNGGDGFVVASLLSDAGASVDVLLAMGMPKTEAAQNAFDNIQKTVGIIDGLENIDEDKEYAVVVDALFGSGFHGKPEGMAEQAIDYANSLYAFNVAVDLPSGVERDTGNVNGICFKADLTVTFTALKPAMMLYPRCQYMGEVVVCDVQLPFRFLYNKMPFADVMEDHDAKWLLPQRDDNSHKGTFGNLLCCTGGNGMAGAAVLCARSALKSGVGLVYQLCSPENYPIITTSVPEVVTVPLQNLPARVQGAKAVVCGCGLGQSVDAEKVLIRSLVTDVPVVLDADALNILSKNSELAHFYKGENMVLTPHPAEAARLLDTTTEQVQADRFAAVKRLAFQYNCTVVLKGANTIIAAPKKRPIVVQSANSGLSKGGSGDCLAGIIGALAAQIGDGFAAACLGVYIHAKAGQLCREKLGKYSMQPSDVIDCLPDVFMSLQN